MAAVQIQIPKALGLSDEDVTRLREQLQSQVIDTIQAAGREVSAAAKAKAEVVHVEVVAL